MRYTCTWWPGIEAHAYIHIHQHAPRDLGVEENLDEVAAGHDELGHQVHVVVPVRPQRRGRLGAVAELGC